MTYAPPSKKIQQTTNLTLQNQNRGEREFPFPAIPGNTGLPFPFPKIGNDFFIPVPKNWECYFSFPFPFPKFGNGNGNEKSIPNFWERERE